MLQLGIYIVVQYAYIYTSNSLLQCYVQSRPCRQLGKNLSWFPSNFLVELGTLQLIKDWHFVSHLKLNKSIYGHPKPEVFFKPGFD